MDGLCQLDHGIHLIVVKELVEPFPAQPLRSDDCTEISDDHVRDPYIILDNPKEIGILFTRVIELHWGDAGGTLFIDVVGIVIPKPSTNVGHMCHRADKSDYVPFAKHGSDDGNVW